MSRAEFFIVLSLCSTVATFGHAEEPAPRDIVDQAIRYAGLDDDLDTWSSRARWSNAIPEFEAGIDLTDTTDFRDQYRETLAESDNDAFSLKSLQNTTTDDSQGRSVLRFKVRWKPAGILFDQAEISAERAARARARDRMLLIEHVTSLIARRIQLKRALRVEEEREQLLTQLIQIELELDALTGGWFAQQLQENHHER